MLSVIAHYIYIALRYNRRNLQRTSWVFDSLITEIVHNGIFYFVRNELGMAELFAEYNGIYGNAILLVALAN